MTSVRFPALLILAIALPSCAFATTDAKNQQEVADLLANAATMANIRSVNSPPFHLRLKIHAQRITTKPVDGSYEEVWLAPDKWRREIVFPGFTQVEVGEKDRRWLKRSADFRPSAAYALSRVVENVVPQSLLPGEKVSEVRSRKKDGMQLRCAEMEGQGWKRTLCFNTLGLLVSTGNHQRRFEYLDYGKFENKLFPRHVVVYDNDRKVLEVSVEDLSAASSLDPSSFQAPAGAEQMAPCERPEPEPIKKVPPQYPDGARQARQQGTVVLYLLLSGDGTLQKLKVLQSAGQSLDQASVDAVKQWAFPPISCGATGLPTETELSIHYELGPY